MIRRYFDNAATSFPKPPGVVEAMVRMMTAVGAPGRGAYAEAREAGRVVRQCRERVARLVNLVDEGGALAAEHVVFGYNTTDGLNLGVKGVLGHARRARGAGAPLHVVTTAMEHNSILRPLHAWAERDPGLSWTVVPADAATGLVDPGAVAAAVRPETVLVCVNHASNVTGTLQDLGAIGAVLARFGAGGDGQLLLLVDGAQSLGHTLVDMRAMRVDMLAFPGHKGLLGPTGTGGLCVRPGVEARLDTVREGGTGSASEVPSHPTMMPEKYEAGSHNVVGIAGLGEGVRWLLERGVEAVRAHELELMARLTAHLRPAPDGRCAGAPGLRLLGPIEPERRVGVFSFVHDELSAQELSAALEVSYGVLTRAGLHCAPLVHELLGTSPAAGGSGAVRLSLGPFLTGEDVDYACAALGALCREYAAVAVK